MVAFSDASTGGAATQWNWDFGDGNVSYAQNPSNTYTTPGTYTVTFDATNACGSSQTTTTITVTPPVTPTCDLIADFTAQPNPATEGDAVAFTSSVQGGISPYTYTWEFERDDGTGAFDTAGTQATASHTYQNASPTGAQGWEVRLTVKDSSSPECLTQITRFVLVRPKLCQVPNFTNDWTDTVQTRWTAAGFTTNVDFDPRRPPEYRVRSQTQKQAERLPCKTTQIRVSNP